MGTEQIKYRKLDRYKYQLRRDYSTDTGIATGRDLGAEGDWVVVDAAGRISLKSGYAWDGPSGPTIDTTTFMRASLVHDGLYQLMRCGELQPSTHRIAADKLLRKMCIEDGMHRFRAGYVYWFVRYFGRGSTDPRGPKTELAAPLSAAGRSAQPGA